MGKEYTEEEKAKMTEGIKENEEQANELMERAKQLLFDAEKIKEELNIPRDNVPDLEDYESEEEIKSKMRLRVPKLEKFSKGGNFSRFCERFEEYVNISKSKDDNLYMLLLSNVDDETYSILKGVELSPEEKRDVTKFCKLYKTAIYGDEAIMLKTDLMRCKQKEEEDIASYAFRLREKANIAYPIKQTGEETCLLVFLQNVRDSEMKKKLNEATFSSFAEAIRQAKKIENASKMDKSNELVEITPILKNIKFEDDDVRRSDQGFRRDRDASRESNNGGHSPGRDRSRERERNYSRARRNSREFMGGRNSRPRQRQSGQGIVCYFCRKIGHKQINCWRKNAQGGNRVTFNTSRNQQEGYGQFQPRGNGNYTRGNNRQNQNFEGRRSQNTTYIQNPQNAGNWSENSSNFNPNQVN